MIFVVKLLLGHNKILNYYYMYQVTSPIDNSGRRRPAFLFICNVSLLKIEIVSNLHKHIIRKL